MRLTFLGTGGYHPNEKRHTACLMLPEIGVVFDAGTGFFRVPQKLQTDDVRIFLSHAHLDHIVGLTYFLVPILKGVVVWAQVFGTRPTLDAVQEHVFAKPIFPVSPPFEFVELKPQIEIPQGGILTHCGLDHPGGCQGYRIDWPDRSFAYITDTMASDRYLEFIRGVDLLVHECNFPDSLRDWAEKTGHSHTTPVAELAKKAGAGRLVLVHVDPELTQEDPLGLETARSIFPETLLAEDLLELEF